MIASLFFDVTETHQQDKKYRDEDADYNNEPPKPPGIVTREKQADYRSKTYHDPDRGCQP